jgi:hypothetical protein
LSFLSGAKKPLKKLPACRFVTIFAEKAKIPPTPQAIICETLITIPTLHFLQKNKQEADFYPHGILGRVNVWLKLHSMGCASPFCKKCNAGIEQNKTL